MDHIAEDVKDVLADALEVSRDIIEPESSLADDLGADSMGLAEIQMGLEEFFNISVPDEDLENFETVSDIISYVEAQQE